MKGLEGLNSLLEQLDKIRTELTKDLTPEERELYRVFNAEYAKLISEGKYKEADSLSKNFKQKLNDRV